MGRFGGKIPKSRGLLTRSERLSLFLGSPLLIVMLGVEVFRIWNAMHGAPLLITGLSGFDVSVQWSVSRLGSIFGMIVHLVVITILAGALWIQFQQARRWLRWRAERFR